MPPEAICRTRGLATSKPCTRRALVTRENLDARLRQSGIDNLALVRAMYLESDATFSVLTYPGAERRTPNRERTPV